MPRPESPLRFVATLAIVALLAVPALAAGPGGTVTKFLRPEVHTFDAKGTPTGVLKAASVKFPAPIVAFGVGNSIGISEGGKTVFLRGIDVDTAGVHAACAPVQTAAREQGTAYAAHNMGLGGAADCQRPAR